MSPSPPYVGRARWVKDITGWTAEFDPPLNVPARTKFDVNFPPPPELGGPPGWFEVQFEYEPVNDTPSFRPSRRLQRDVLKWVEASKTMLEELKASGVIVNRSDDPPANMVARSHVLASGAIEITRAMMLLVALMQGRDIVQLDQQLHRDAEDRRDQR